MITLLQAQGAASPLLSVGMLVLIVLVFYLFMIRPQMKRQKELRKFQDSLSTGDAVIVSGGIHGKITQVRDVDVMVEIARDVEIRVSKASVYADASGCCSAR